MLENYASDPALWNVDPVAVWALWRLLLLPPMNTSQWRIQDFPKGDANSREEVSTYYSAKISLKLHVKGENFNWVRRVHVQNLHK